VETIDKGGSTAIAEGVWIKGGVVLAHSSSLIYESDRSVFDGVDSREHESDCTEGEHGSGMHRNSGGAERWK